MTISRTFFNFLVLCCSCWQYRRHLNSRFYILRLNFKIMKLKRVFLIPLIWFFPLCFGFQVRHRWCELVVKHAYTQAYRDVEHFLVHDQVNTTNPSNTDSRFTWLEKWANWLCMYVPGYGCIFVWRADGSGGPWAAGSGLSMSLVGPGRNGPIGTQSGGGDGPVTLKVKSHSQFFINEKCVLTMLCQSQNWPKENIHGAKNQ